MHKFFVKNKQINDNIIEINGTDVNHIINVLRLKIDDTIQVCNQDTSENFIAQITDYDSNKVMCSIVNEIVSDIETKFDLDIYQGLPKADKMELIIQKTTELGVKNIIPVAMERCVVKLNQKDRIKKIDRWQKIAEVAAKQSKRDIIPEVKEVISINDICNNIINNYDIFIVAYEEEKTSTLKEVLQNNKTAKRIGILVGPEGGIDSKEIDKLKNSGAKIITLGNRILRTETAPIVIAGNVIYELEN